MAQKPLNQNLLLFGLRLKDVRVQFGFSLEELAKRLGVSATHLCNLERGRREPSFSLLVLIAEDMNLSLDYLVLGRPDAMRESALIFRSDDELLSAFVGEPRRAPR